MEFREILRRRRVVRSYRDEAVDLEAVRRVVASVRHAPSAGFTQAQRLLVVTRRELRGEIAALARRDSGTGRTSAREPWMARAPVYVVVTTSESAYRSRYRETDKLPAGAREVEWEVPYWYVDAGGVLVLLLLAAADEGLAAGVFGVAGRFAELKELLELPDDVLPIGIVTLGYEAFDPMRAQTKRRLDARRKSLDELVYWEAWGEGEPS